MNRRRWRQLVVCAGVALAVAAPTGATAAPLAATSLPALPGAEAEPNNSAEAASPIQSGERIRANLGAGDVDYYRFTALAGERVFANTVTAGSTSSSPNDTLLTLFASDGVTPLASDDNNGSQLGLASSLAEVLIPADGTYYLEVKEAGGAAVTPYDLYLQLRSGVAATEVEPNEFPKANPLIGGEVTGIHLAQDEDRFSISLQAGDTVFLSLGLGGADVSKAQLGFGLAGDSGSPQVLAVPAESEAPESVSPSEALTMTVSRSGTYYASVKSSDPSVSEPAFTYDLSATVIPASQPSCRTYSSAGSPPLDGGTVAFPIAVEDAALITRAAVHLELEESVMADLDVSLRSPAATEVPLFTDIGSPAPGGQIQLDAVFDDFAAVPPLYRALRPLDLQLEGGGRLASFENQNTQGTWSVIVRDDTANSSVGNVKGIDLILCGSQLPPAQDPGSNLGRQQQQQQRVATPPPVLSGLTVAPGEFAAAKSGPMVLAKRPASGGALVSYQDSEAAQTNFILTEANPGRKVGAKCVRPTKGNATKKPCTRWVKVISFVRNDVAGRNRFGFSGRVGARKLPPGEFQLQARAYATSGLISDPVAVIFRVIAAAPAKASK